MSFILAFAIPASSSFVTTSVAGEFGEDLANESPQKLFAVPVAKDPVAESRVRPDPSFPTSLAQKAGPLTLVLDPEHEGLSIAGP